LKTIWFNGTQIGLQPFCILQIKREYELPNLSMEACFKEEDIFSKKKLFQFLITTLKTTFLVGFCFSFTQEATWKIIVPNYSAEI